MQKLIFLFALLTAQAWAGEAVRCGTDAFGNAVCMDKDGVVSAAPKAQSGVASAKDDASGNSNESGVKPGNENQTGKPRCGIDPFGNKVCQ